MNTGTHISMSTEGNPTLSAHISAPLPCMNLSIFSDSLLLREGLDTLFAKMSSLQLVGHYNGAEIDISALPNPHGHLVLIDAGLGRQRLAQLTRTWRMRLPAPWVLALDLCPDTELILDCIEWGVSGYTLQGEGFSIVLDVIRETICGRARCSPEVTACLFERLADHASTSTLQDPGLVPLTNREREILGYIARNYSNREIADALVIEQRTVKHHVHNILHKLKLSHRWDAARLASQRGWLTDMQHRI